MNNHEIGTLLSGTSLIFNALIRHLEAKGAMSREEFRKLLTEQAAQKHDDPDAKTMLRLDYMLFENLAALLGNPEPPPGWRPRVIDGGKSDPAPT